MRVDRLGAFGCIASLVGACSVPNPAFDPPRKNDTDALPPADDGSDGGETTLPPATDDGEDTMPVDDTGSVGPLCNGAPEEKLGLRIFREGNPIQRCGTVTERDCILTRNETQARWELTGCCLDDQACATDSAYVVEFGPAGPDVMLDQMAVGVAFSFSPADVGCNLEWVEIVQNEGVPPNVPPLLYAAAASLAAGEHISVPAEPGVPLPDEVCACAEADVACCPEGLGRHTLNVAVASGTVVLNPETMPSDIVPIPDSELAIEVILVRSWQPPYCDAPPEYQWIARRYWL